MSTDDMPSLVMSVDGIQVEVASQWEDTDKDLRTTAKEIRKRYNVYDELLDAIEQALTASEDGGDMDDIDWKQLQTLYTKYRGK